jgi:hypothetical protein
MATLSATVDNAHSRGGHHGLHRADGGRTAGIAGGVHRDDLEETAEGNRRAASRRPKVLARFPRLDFHRAAGYESGDEKVKAVLSGIRRTIGAAPVRKKAATSDLGGRPERRTVTQRWPAARSIPRGRQLELAADFAKASKAKATQDAYGSDFRIFEAW